MGHASSHKRGFTIIEVMVAIGVIGILSTIAALSYEILRSNSRDNQRKVTAAIITDALEIYYSKNGEYPGCDDMTQSAELTAAFIEIEPASTLQAPKNSNENSLRCDAIPSGEDWYAYIGTGGTNCSTSGYCDSWTFQYYEEDTGDTISFSSKH